jgi:hypothetical protein
VVYLYASCSIFSVYSTQQLVGFLKGIKPMLKRLATKLPKINPRDSIPATAVISSFRQAFANCSVAK